MTGIWDSPRTLRRPYLDGGEPSLRRTSGTRSRSTSWVSERYRPPYARSRNAYRIVGADSRDWICLGAGGKGHRAVEHDLSPDLDHQMDGEIVA